MWPVAACREERGQAAVEFAVVLPVIFIVMVITVDCMSFMGECARFDNLAAQHVVELAASPGKSTYAADARVEAVQQALAEDFSAQGQSVEVTGEKASTLFANMTAYRCTLSMAPWPLSRPGASVFGVGVPLSLEHEHVIVVDPYTPGKLW